MAVSHDRPKVTSSTAVSLSGLRELTVASHSRVDPSMESDPLVFVPAINANDHGRKVILAGALMLAPVSMMTAISMYNRIAAKTFGSVDNIVAISGIILDFGAFATAAIAVSHGFGKHANTISPRNQGAVAQTIGAALLIWFLSQACIKLSYNMLARRTARSVRFTRVVDVASAFIVLWSFANVIVMAHSIANKVAPAHAFFMASGLSSICILVGQLMSFLWIIWTTSARRLVKIRWSASIGAFVPACIVVVICRLAITPSDLFSGDWTFTTIPVAVVFLIEINLSILNLLAPSLPVFFDMTSTGGLYFRPGDTMRTEGISSNGQSRQKSGTKRSNRRSRHGVMDDEEPIQLTKLDGMHSTAVRRESERKRASFDSDTILVRRSVEIS